MPESNIKRIAEYFGMKNPEMVREWKELSQEERAQIRNGIIDGSLTY